MVRPCFLVVDREHASSISTRKLVIETAKMNVLTAYTAHEAVETLSKFPGMHGAVIDVVQSDMTCKELAAKLKAIQPDIPIIAISGPTRELCEGADYHLDSFSPGPLLDLLRELVPAEVAVIEKRNLELEIGGN